MYKLHIERHLSAGDDTVLNGITFDCYTRDGEHVARIGTQGPFPETTADSDECSAGTFLRWARLRSEPPQGTVYDTIYHLAAMTFLAKSVYNTLYRRWR